MSKMEIELNEEQEKKVEILKEHDISVGEAIDLLFDVKKIAYDQSNEYVDNKLSEIQKEKEELEAKLSKVDQEISVFTKLKDTSLDADAKTKILEKEYVKIDETYDVKVQDAKRKFKWTKDIFRF